MREWLSPREDLGRLVVSAAAVVVWEEGAGSGRGHQNEYHIKSRFVSAAAMGRGSGRSVG